MTKSCKSLAPLLCVALGFLSTKPLQFFIGCTCPSEKTSASTAKLACGGLEEDKRPLLQECRATSFQEQPSLEPQSGDGSPDFASEDELGQLFVHQWAKTPWGHSHSLVGGFETVRVMSGVVDLLAVHRNHKELLVLELKRKNASHRVLGQLLRYLGDAALLWPEFTVHGAIVAGHATDGAQIALAATPWVNFYSFTVAGSLLGIALVVPVPCFSMASITMPPRFLYNLWQRGKWSNTHDLMTGRRLSCADLELVGRQKDGEDDEILVVHMIGKKSSFPRLSVLLLEMGKHIATGYSLVRGALVVREATPRLLYAARACGIEVWETCSWCSNWRRPLCQKCDTRGRVLTTCTITLLREQLTGGRLLGVSNKNFQEFRRQ